MRIGALHISLLTYCSTYLLIRDLVTQVLHVKVNGSATSSSESFVTDDLVVGVVLMNVLI